MHSKTTVADEAAISNTTSMSKTAKKAKWLPTTAQLISELSDGVKREWTLGQRIAVAREMKSLSQTKLAKSVDVSRGAVGQWESGKTEPSAANLRKIAMLLNVDYDWLATGRGKAPLRRDDDGPSFLAGAPVKIEMTVTLGENATLSETSEMIKRLRDALGGDGRITGQVEVGGEKLKF